MPRDEVAGQSQPAYQPEQSETYGYSQVGAPAPRGSGATNVKPKNLGALREIPVFDPEKEGGVKVGDFLEAVQNVAVLGNLDDDDIMRVMPMRLLGPAKGFFRTFLASKQAGTESEAGKLGKFWPAFKTGLNDRFSKPTDPVAHLMQLTSCQQGDTETARGYAQRVRALAYKTWPQFTQSQDEATRKLGETLMYQHFLKGLKPHNIERIHLKGIRDMDTAVLELTNKETFDALQRSAGRVVGVNHVEEGGRSEIDEFRGVIRDLKDTVAAHLTETAELIRAHASMLPGSVHTANGSQFPAYDSPYYDPAPTGGCHQGFSAYVEQQGSGTADGRWGAMPSGPQSICGTPYGYGSADGWSGDGMAQSVNAVNYQPRLPQTPMVRPPVPRAAAPFRPAGQQMRATVACFHCGGPHYVRNCPSLPPNAAHRYFPGSGPGPLPRMYRPNGPGPNYAAGGRMPGPAAQPPRPAGVPQRSLN